MADVNTGANAVLRMEAWVTGTNVAGNYNNYHWRISLIERSPGSLGWSGGGIPASLEVFWEGGGYLNPWNGSFGYDFRPGGQQSVVIAEGDLNGMGNKENGAPRTFQFRANMGNSGTSTAGGPALVDHYVAGAQTILKPNAPAITQVARISDTQAQVTLSQTNPSNGQPYSNQIYARVNGGAFSLVADVQATNVITVGVGPNQKVEFQARAWNSAGASGIAGTSSPIYTTPGTPSGVATTKDAAGNIDITFTENVDYSEHTHELWHGTVTGGVVTWDGSALATLASGVTSYEHTVPNPAQQHRYRVRSKAGALMSPWVESNTVQLLAPPAKPTIPAQPAFANRAAVFRFPWVFNSVDSSPQSKYQWRWSTNGGTTWTTGAKTASTNKYHDFAANTWAANAAVTFQVRTKGSYDAGSDADASYSPWSDPVTVTFKSLPTASITSPANGSTVNESTVRVNVGFTQPEGATFVKAELRLNRTTGGTVLLESLESTNQVGITFNTPAQNGVNYSVQARVQDSNGLWSGWVTNAFSVTYLAPVPAGVAVSYIESQGYGQIDLTIAAPGAGQSAATTVTITRAIDGLTETVVENYPVSAALTFLDTTPTIHGTNTYVITTYSALGAKSSVTVDLVTTECRRAFLSKGPGFASFGVFGANLEVSESLSVASATLEAAGRIKPIGLYGVETNVKLKVKSFIFKREGYSTIPELRAILLLPGKACFRDSSGRRVFGVATGSIDYKKTDRGELSFTMTETS